MVKKLFMRKKEGFTLIELLIVVAIIGILAGIAIPNFLGARTKAKVSRAFADMRTIGTALESYMVDNDCYPTSTSANDLITGNYISSFPKDPFNSQGTRTIDQGAMIEDGYGFYTSPNESPTMWLLVSNGPDTVANVTSDVLTWINPVSGQLGGTDGATGMHYVAEDAWWNGEDLPGSGDIGRGGP